MLGTGDDEVADAVSPSTVKSGVDVLCCPKSDPSQPSHEPCPYRALRRVVQWLRGGVVGMSFWDWDAFHCLLLATFNLSRSTLCHGRCDPYIPEYEELVGRLTVENL